MFAKGRGGSAADKLEAAAGVREVAGAWRGADGAAEALLIRARTKSSLSKNPAVEIPLTPGDVSVATVGHAQLRDTWQLRRSNCYAAV